MNSQQLELITWAVWLAICTLLLCLALYSKEVAAKLAPRTPEFVFSVLWAAFIAFTFCIIPVMAFGVSVVPASWFLLEACLALSFGLRTSGEIPELTRSFLYLHAAPVIGLFIFSGAILFVVARKRNNV